MINLKVITAKRLSFLIVFFLFIAVSAQQENSLAYFLKQAESSTPLLNDYNNQIISNKIDSLKLKATYGFIVSGEANATVAPHMNGWGYDISLTNGQSLFAGVRVAKQFISKSNLNTRLAAFNASIAQISAQKNVSIQTLKKQITDQYIAAYTNQEKFQLSQEIIRILNQEDLVLKKLTQASVFKQTDYLAFKVTLQQNLLAFQQQKADWQNNYAVLNYLSGTVDQNFSLLQAPDFTKNLQPQSFDESIYKKSFLADSLKTANDAEIIKYDYKPKISAFTDAGYQSSFEMTPYKNFGLSFGVGISVPIYDGHLKKMLLQQNQLTSDTRKKYLEKNQLQYQQYIFQLNNQIDQYYKLLETARQQISYAKTLVEANAKQLPTGDVKVVDFISSINNLLNLKGNIIQYNSSLMSLQNQLQYLIIPQ